VQGISTAQTIVTTLTEPMASLWWLGPILVLWGWGVVPIQRSRHNVLQSDQEDRPGTMTRFWWAPGWGYLGVVGVGLCLITSPLLSPGLAAQWAPGAWLGVSMDSLTWRQMSTLVVAGVILTGKGLLLYGHAWVADRCLRYRAWRWRMGYEPRPTSLPSRELDGEDPRV